MTSKTRKLDVARDNSRRLPKVDLIIEDEEQREFYRYSAGMLVEYDLTKANGHSLKLEDEEMAALLEFSCPILTDLKI